MSGSRLTNKQGLFVAEYLVDHNATKAAIRAGYSAKTASRIGPQTLEKPWVNAVVQAKQKKIADRLGVTAERVISELARLAFSDMAKFADWGPDGVRLKDSLQLSADDARCVAELGETTSKDGGSRRFKLHDKKGALDSLAKHLGLFAPEKLEHSGPGGTPLEPLSLTVRFVKPGGTDK